MFLAGSAATEDDTGWNRRTDASEQSWGVRLWPFGEIGVGLRRAPKLPLTGVGLSVLALAALMAVFGMPPVDMHSPLHRLGVMDPFCGMTRGTVAVMRGSIVEAWRYNPASLLVLPAAAMLVVRGLAGRVTGRWIVLDWHLAPAGWGLVVVVVAVLWANQQAHAALLMR